MKILRSVLLAGADYAKREWFWRVSFWDFAVTMFWAFYRMSYGMLAAIFWPAPKKLITARLNKCRQCPVFYEPHQSCGFSGMPRNLQGCGCSLLLKTYDKSAECWLYLYTNDAAYKWPTKGEDGGTNCSTI